jgi:hypothetical protein
MSTECRTPRLTATPMPYPFSTASKAKDFAKRQIDSNYSPSSGLYIRESNWWVFRHRRLFGFSSPKPAIVTRSNSCFEVSCVIASLFAARGRTR